MHLVRPRICSRQRGIVQKDESVSQHQKSINFKPLWFNNTTAIPQGWVTSFLAFCPKGFQPPRNIKRCYTIPKWLKQKIDNDKCWHRCEAVRHCTCFWGRGYKRVKAMCLTAGIRRLHKLHLHTARSQWGSFLTLRQQNHTCTP